MNVFFQFSSARIFINFLHKSVSVTKKGEQRGGRVVRSKVLLTAVYWIFHKGLRERESLPVGDATSEAFAFFIEREKSGGGVEEIKRDREREKGEKKLCLLFLPLVSHLAGPSARFSISFSFSRHERFSPCGVLEGRGPSSRGGESGGERQNGQRLESVTERDVKEIKVYSTALLRVSLKSLDHRKNAISQTCSYLESSFWNPLID